VPLLHDAGFSTVDVIAGITDDTVVYVATRSLEPAQA
jgi:hypothetical protein